MTDECAHEIKVLYITFIDIKANQNSGSSVRPLRMLQAFSDMGCSVTVLEGQQNRVFDRHRRVSRILNGLKRGERYDLCYVEPPSGPFLCPTDLALLKRLKHHGIPIGLFYRDAYYLFPDSFSSKIPLKDAAIAYMTKRDRKVFSKTCSIIYVPTASFGRLVSFPTKTKPLPPGCSGFEQQLIEGKSEELTAIYVGGVSEEYGSPLVLDSFMRARQKGYSVKLIFVCPEGSWSFLPERYQAFERYDWLEVVHASGAGLEAYYQRADFGIIPRLRTPYNDIAFPVKLVEYLSHGLPLLSTDCTAVEEFVSRWNIGLIANDSVASFSDAIMDFAKMQNVREAYRDAIIEACDKNSWGQRAYSVIEDLVSVSSSDS
ncbi:glycosyltransferase [Enterorhabdus mucosicola]|uniref:Glycosyltransferase n=1 Tax=Adlercreutzia mucosicola TaxID=580026 RepID=A0A6N8JMI0_9ACTN|nr:glycosyltransferase family 4 protein [Adlercreutzia mucosicola]MVX61081.1 glycosyltransferase [Adlercreutzia mucosicola]